MPDDWSLYLGINPDDIEAGSYIDLPDNMWPDEDEQREGGDAPRQSSKKQELNEAEMKFVRLWKIYGDEAFEYEAQYYFDEEREYRSDFAFVEQRVMVEIDGMSGENGHVGGHRSWHGYQDDRERDLRAVELGWVVVRIPTTWLETKQAIEAIGKIVNILKGT